MNLEINSLKSTYLQLLEPLTNKSSVAEDFWHEIETAYTAAGRHYHNLTHLYKLLQQLNEVRALIRDWDIILFTLYYHDAVYDPLRTDNEAQSAALAVERLRSLHIAESRIAHCKVQILATSGHHTHVDADTNYFTDADLSVLGQDQTDYREYLQQIRKEYQVYPDHVFNAGRKKVLENFLSMDRLFKTAYFYARFETRARVNLRQELKNL